MEIHFQLLPPLCHRNLLLLPLPAVLNLSPPAHITTCRRHPPLVEEVDVVRCQKIRLSTPPEPPLMTGGDVQLQLITQGTDVWLLVRRSGVLVCVKDGLLQATEAAVRLDSPEMIVVAKVTVELVREEEKEVNQGRTEAEPEDERGEKQAGRCLTDHVDFGTLMQDFPESKQTDVDVIDCTEMKQTVVDVTEWTAALREDEVRILICKK
jgi:acetamidase/formamidase